MYSMILHWPTPFISSLKHVLETFLRLKKPLVWEQLLHPLIPSSGWRRKLHTCWDADSDDVRHVVVLRWTERVEGVCGGVRGAHFQPRGAMRPDSELHQTLPIFHHSAWNNNRLTARTVSGNWNLSWYDSNSSTVFGDRVVKDSSTVKPCCCLD